MIPGFIHYFFSQIMLNMITYTQFLDDSKIHVEKKNPETKLSEGSPTFKDRIIQGDEVEMVMGNLGIFCSFEGENFPESFKFEDLFNIFEEEQPSLDEVKEAFDVFDENRDGFIDARELHRVLSVLGMKNEAAMDDCKKMIEVFDDDNDGRIDFYEFIKCMEGTFC
ncbi:hypothetical protein SSX86_029087 [Deinandra increscens subsp. villosa]|uniref:EF-hand domain-containing protein n=1 Tax=Deinandra increscens subsp. villosa TaxID=3103831 RepID=A0AAP0CBY2_9ASTR